MSSDFLLNSVIRLLAETSSSGDVLGARKVLFDALGNMEETKIIKLHMAETLLRADPVNPEYVKEVELLLTFADDPVSGYGTAGLSYDAQLVKGHMYRGLGKLDNSIKAFQKAFNWRPDQLQAAQLLSTVLVEAGRSQEATEIMSEHTALLDNNLSNLAVWQDPGNHEIDNGSKYLNLLEKTLCNWIYGDSSHPSYGNTAFDRRRRDVGRDLPEIAHSMIGLRRLRHLRWVMEIIISEKIQGNCIEAGVWRGGACILMRGVLAARGDTNRLIFVADSFSGLPAPDIRFPKDLAALHAFHVRPELAISLENVKQNFAMYDLLDDQVQFVPGFFKDTLSQLDTGQLALLRLDSDMYSSTMETLNTLYDKVSPGGFVICDDYGVLLDAQRAILDFRKSRCITNQMISVDGDAVFWRIERS